MAINKEASSQIKGGIFYSVGIGPGDPMLMTLKAVSTIELSDIIAVPKSGADQNIALKIAKDYISSKTIIECDMPMTRDTNLLKCCHDNAVAAISALLEQGKIVSFLTLGDPTVYSTAMYVHKGLTERGYRTEIVSGVPSFCAAAASLNTTLCEGGQPLHIIPASYKDTDSLLDLDGNKVLMKSGKSILDVRDRIKQNNLTGMMVECATMENERVYKSLDEIEAGASYFSVVLLKSNE